MRKLVWFAVAITAVTLASCGRATPTSIEVRGVDTLDTVAVDTPTTQAVVSAK